MLQSIRERNKVGLFCLRSLEGKVGNRTVEGAVRVAVAKAKTGSALQPTVPGLRIKRAPKGVKVCFF